VAENPFRIEIYDKAFGFQCLIGDPRNLTVTPRYNQISTATFAVDADHRRLPQLLADGARAVVSYHGEVLVSGPINLRQAQGPAISGIVTLYVDGDFRILDNVLAWTVPTAAISAQTAEYYVLTGGAEFIVKDLVTKNAINRLGMPVVCAGDLSRGAVIPGGIKARFQSLRDVLLPAVETAGIGITFQQSGTSIVCDVYAPITYPVTLSENAGMITDWTWSSRNPTTTRVVTGGAGDGTARVFRAVSDPTLEATFGDKVEVFRDARDADTTTLQDARGQETLTEGAAKYGFSLTLAETDTFRYGGPGGVHVGDIVTVDLGFATRTDVLREATLTWNTDDGVQVTPRVGEIQDNPDRALGDFLRKLRKGISDLKVSK
jgi:hypothetical protein